MSNLAEMIIAVELHALANYEKNGWDYVVECWGPDDILDAIEGCKTPAQAIRAVGAIVKTLADYRDDIRATAW